MYKNPFEHLSGKITNSKVEQAGFQELQFNTGQIVLIPAQMGTWESYSKVMVPLSENSKCML